MEFGPVTEIYLLILIVMRASASFGNLAAKVVNAQIAFWPVWEENGTIR